MRRKLATSKLYVTCIVLVQIDEDFIAYYQASYGFVEEDGEVKAAPTVPVEADSSLSAQVSFVQSKVVVHQCICVRVCACVDQRKSAPSDHSCSRHARTHTHIFIV